MSRYDNELLAINRGWEYKRRGDLWSFPRNGRTYDGKFLRETDYRKIQKTLFLLERGFVFARSGWTRGRAVLEAKLFELDQPEFEKAVKQRLIESFVGDEKWTNRIAGRLPAEE